MPLFGHGFIGLGAAQYTKPQARDSIGAAIWVTILLFLNYLPDIIYQICLFFRLHGVETIAHSLCAAVVLSLIMSVVIMALAHLSFRRAFLISLCSMLVHDLLDLVHTPERLFLWPLSNWRLNSEYSLPAMSLKNEILLFGSLYFASWLVYRVWFDKHDSQPLRFKITRQKYLVWLSRFTVIIIFVCAGTIHYLRNIRAEQFYQARAIVLSNKNYTRALDLLQEADRWPYGTSLAGIDYYKARALWGLGDTKQAEQYYLKSMEENPWDFWCIGDLALFYASGKEAVAERRNRVTPYVKKLLTYYPNHQYLKIYLHKIESALGAPLDVGYDLSILAKSKKVPSTKM